ncbi:chemotaxis protein CheA [Jonesia quinghaiensis]|uniref:chemotaxis protein CheA n=1 Tax=Jonesia quinghaiensis TaxID=262806 RepID=UPI00056391B3|nr:chemotaxis protein CheA [Jonesia quinghaiensis]
MDEIVREFLIESNENLDQLDQDLVALESEPGSRELLSSVFRTIHTIKGTSGFLALTRLESVAHVGENLLVELRDGKREMEKRTADVLLMMVDTIRALLVRLEESGNEEGIDIEATVSAIQATLDNEPLPEEPVQAPQAVLDSPEPATPVVTSTPADNAAPADIDVPEPPVEAALPALEIFETEPVAPAPQAPAAQPVKKSVASANAAPAQNAPERRSTSDSSIRVDVDLLDELMRQVGELVLVRNQISQLAGYDSGDLLRSSQRLSLIASELQEGVMKTRMQPIEHIWSKMPRVVRDLASACKRDVRLEMVGGDTELDRSLLESVKDPLTHLVRNAIDHGIESPDDRVAMGKPRVGVLTLRAYHASGQVMVEVIDDGAGIDPARVAAKAVERGLKTPEQLDQMTPNEIQNLVFLAGFSTAAAVTNVSGRGVGMDVVRSNIESIGGAVEVESAVGRGTTWRLRIPLTLAIMPALTVQSGNEIYAIPQVNLQELVALDTEKTKSAIELIGSAEVYRLRGSLLPLVRLSTVLGKPHNDEGTAVIAVLQADNQRFGLVVDRVMNNEEIVVKPLATALKTIGIYAGATLMGDGAVALILDIQAITRRSLNSDGTDLMGTRLGEEESSFGENTTEYLVVSIGEERRVAIPLEAVTRLEQIKPERLETVAGREVLQYRDSIVPVIRLGRYLGVYSDMPGEDIQLVIFTHGNRTVAVLVEEIIEILNDAGATRSEVAEGGLLGSMVLSGRVTELLDLPAALMTADPVFYEDVASFDSELVGA